MKTKTKKAKQRQVAQTDPAKTKATAPAATKCQAKAVGHRRCQCGGPECGENIQPT